MLQNQECEINSISFLCQKLSPYLKQPTLLEWSFHNNDNISSILVSLPEKKGKKCREAFSDEFVYIYLCLI